ncbi:MAG: hypothetical protein ABMA02_06745 [Saprospiraceae bacterium]
MKRPIAPFLFAIFISVLFAPACKKDEASLEERLVAASCWGVTKAEEFDPITNKWEDVTLKEYGECDLDDCYTFYSDHNLIVSHENIKCDPNEPNTESAVWSISSDGKIFKLTKSNGDAASFTIIELSSSVFVIEVTFGGGVKDRTTLMN